MLLMKAPVRWLALAVASLLAWLVCGPNKKFLPNYDGGNIISLAK